MPFAAIFLLAASLPGGLGLAVFAGATAVNAAEPATVGQASGEPAQDGQTGSENRSGTENENAPESANAKDAGKAAAEKKGYSIPPRYILVDPATGLAIGGYDPVAYFVDRRPRLGKPRFELVWSETIWRFVNEGNMAAFKAAPEIYAPQFGGHDAQVIAEGQLAPGDPKVWAIYRQRLYLFYSPARRFSWMVAPDSYLRQAVRAWDKRLNFKIEIDLQP